MFQGFANVWTPVVPAGELKQKPLPLTLAGEPLVLFRDRRGGLGALLDRCPHRGVALSLGQVDADGCLTCPFHGWTFRTDGSCAHVPLNEVPEERRARYGATALPVREIGGLIWVFTGRDAAGTAPHVPENLLEPGWRVSWFHETWDAHWTRAMENMLDMPHLPFVHRRTIGGGLRARMKRDSVMRLSLAEEPSGFRVQTEFAGESAAPFAWCKPNGMVLDIMTEPRRLRGHVYCVPVDARRTRMIIGSARDFPLGPLGLLNDLFNRRVALEDRRVVESSTPAEAPPAGEELSVATDGPTLHFRRYYYRELRGSSSAIIPASRLASRSGARETSAAAALESAASVAE